MGGTWAIFTCYWMNSEKYSCILGYSVWAVSIHAVHQGCNSTLVKVGSGMGLGPATEVTHLRLNQPPVFFSVCDNVFGNCNQTL